MISIEMTMDATIRWSVDYFKPIPRYHFVNDYDYFKLKKSNEVKKGLMQEA